MVLAPTRDQSQGLFTLIQGAIAEAPALRKLIENVTAETIELKSKVDIVIRPASYRSTRGSTCIAVMLDEIAHFRSDDSMQPDTEILRALRPSLATTNGQLVAISSPYARKGELWKNYSRHYGKDTRVLAIQAPSWTMHPGIDPEFLRQQYEDDPTSAAAEFGAEFRSDVESFVRLEAVQAVVPAGVFERPFIRGHRYHGFVDPSGGSADSMTLAVSHRERSNGIDIAVLDVLREAKPPFSPARVVAQFSQTLNDYHIRTVYGDRYSGEWCREQFRWYNVHYRPSDAPKSEIYGDLLLLVNSARVSLLDDKRLIAQLCGLERKTSRAGKDSVDHAPGGRDDVINAAAGSLVNAVSNKNAWSQVPFQV